MIKCDDPEIGRLLPAYEFGGLAEEDIKLFEIHLMGCEYCYNEVRKFMDFTNVIRHSKMARNEMKNLSEVMGSISLSVRLMDYLWPKTPLIFRPAISFILILLMIVPAFYGLNFMLSNESEIRPVQSIHFTGVRSLDEQILRIEAGLDGIIRFGMPDYSYGKEYSLSLIGKDGEEILYFSNFNAIDERGMGELILPNAWMSPGDYRLIVERLNSDSTRNHMEYPFKIE